jgi:hypothetical protein
MAINPLSSKPGNATTNANANSLTSANKITASIVKPAIAPVTAKPATPPSTIVSLGNKAPALGLYSPPKATAKPAPPPPPPPKPEKLATNTNGVVAGKNNVVIDIEASDSGFNNKIFYSTDNFKTKTYLGVDNQTGSVDLGTFKPGTTIQFGIDNGQGDFFTTGGKKANVDKFDHTKFTSGSDGSVRVGFEDLRGGGDKDFNDAIIRVRSVAGGLTPAPVPAKTTSAPPSPVTDFINPVKASDNRSGLGDGTNPGQGAGRDNATNTGTLNPGGIR